MVLELLLSSVFSARVGLACCVLSVLVRTRSGASCCSGRLGLPGRSLRLTSGCGGVGGGGDWLGRA